MVELSGDAPYQNSIDNNVLVVAALVVAAIFGFFAYKLVSNLRAKEKAKEEKKKIKQQKKEKAESTKKTASSPKKSK